MLGQPAVRRPQAVVGAGALGIEAGEHGAGGGVDQRPDRLDPLEQVAQLLGSDDGEVGRAQGLRRTSDRRELVGERRPMLLVRELVLELPSSFHAAHRIERMFDVQGPLAGTRVD